MKYLNVMLMHTQQGGEKVDCFNELYKSVEKKLYGFVMKLTGDKYLTEEILQETFYRALCSMAAGGEELSHSWFFTVARNQYYDICRRKRRQGEGDGMDEEAQSFLGIPELELEKSETRAAIQATLEQLSENYREIIMLRVYEELSYADIAKRLDMSIDQVKVTLFRARNKFRNIYKGGD